MYRLAPIFLAFSVALFIIGLHQIYLTGQIQANYGFFMFAVGFLFLAGYMRKFGKKPEKKAKKDKEQRPNKAATQERPQLSRQQRRLQEKHSKKK